MDNHLRQVKDKSEANTSPEEKNLSKLVFFNLVFILQYIQTFLKDIIQFLTQKEYYYSEKDNSNDGLNNTQKESKKKTNNDMYNKLKWNKLNNFIIPKIIQELYPKLKFQDYFNLKNVLMNIFLLSF